MNVVIALSLAYMAVIVIYNVAKFFSGDRAAKLTYLKSFKSAKVFVLYLAALPLYYLAFRYNGDPVGGSILNAVRSTVESVVLKYNYDVTAALMEANLFYRVTLDICRVLIALNACIFVCAVAGQKLYNRLKFVTALRFYRKVYVIIGYNEKNKDVIRSIGRKGSVAVVLIADGKDDAADFAFVNKAGYTAVNGYGDLGALAERICGMGADKKVTVVVNTLDDASNLVCADRLSEAIIAKDLSRFTIDLTRGLSCYVFGGPRNEAQFAHYSQKTNGCIRYVNKYKLIAAEFVSEYPITRFMDERHIDYSAALVRKETEVKTVFVGFGETNRHLLLASVANNQVPVDTGKELEPLKVKYYFYDRVSSENNKILNFGYYRYKEFYASVKGTDAEKEYLPIPPLPAEEHYRTLDINDGKFYESVCRDLSFGEGRIPYNYLIIAYGDDMENLDFADKLAQKAVEWGIAEHTKIFVKIRNGILAEQVVAKEYGAGGRMIPFGVETVTVYDMAAIEAEKYEGMSRERHLCYALEGEMAKSGKKELDPITTERVRETAVRQWYGWQRVQRDSNVYACLNIRLKLNLLGYDFEKGEWDERTAAEFMNKYSTGDPIAYIGGFEVPGNTEAKKAVDYGDCEFRTGTVRNTYAQQEHMRWNAYEISCGMIPASKTEILKYGSAELMKVRKHRNITTYRGLMQYRDMTAEKNGCSKAQADVIKYDYQIADDLCWLLKDNGYRIVSKIK